MHPSTFTIVTVTIVIDTEKYKSEGIGEQAGKGKLPFQWNGKVSFLNECQM